MGPARGPHSFEAPVQTPVQFLASAQVQGPLILNPSITKKEKKSKWPENKSMVQRKTSLLMRIAKPQKKKLRKTVNLNVMNPFNPGGFRAAWAQPSITDQFPPSVTYAQHSTINAHSLWTLLSTGNVSFIWRGWQGTKEGPVSPIQDPLGMSLGTKMV
jgi:hypothetical protein